MMTLEKFAEAVRSEVAKRLGAGFHVHVLKPVINNDIVQTQLCIEKEGQQFRPSKSINAEEVPADERLSQHAYRYCSAEDKVICI